MLTRILLLCFAFGTSFVVAQADPHVQGIKKELQICTPLQCSYTANNISIGLGLQISDSSLVQFLPGQYSTSVVQSLTMQKYLTSKTPIVSTPGFSLSSAAPPFNVTLQPGLVVYSHQFYSGQANFISLGDTFSSQTIPISNNGSIAISENVWVAISHGSENPTIFYDTAPLMTFPSTNQPITIIDYQSTTCQPPCTGTGHCTASGKCACASGFTGTMCDSCALGFFGPECKPCPSSCKSCDQKSGTCLTPNASNDKRAPAQNTCNCQNGLCDTDGKCTCLPGWNGTTCNRCARSFYLATTGNTSNCQTCNYGCSDCDDETGNCNSCIKKFVLDLSDRTKCNPLPSSCPDGSYSTVDSDECLQCSLSCDTCNGPSSANCTTCPLDSKKITTMFNGKCTTVNSDGVCVGTNGMIANNGKKMCDACPSNCTTCEIPGFGRGSTIDQVKCTGCVPGSALSKGKCVTLSCQKGQFASNSTCQACSSSCATCTKFSDNCLSCPKGQFLSGTTCKPCSSICATCSKTADNCLTCSNRLASGKCAMSCPEGTFNISNTCVGCYGDCAACSGPYSNQCTKCPPNRPVLSDGRCFRRCGSKTQFFDHSTSSCKDCDPSCSSCFAAGPNNCLACANSSEILQNGSCSLPPLVHFAYLGVSWPNHPANPGPIISYV